MGDNFPRQEPIHIMDIMDLCDELLPLMFTQCNRRVLDLDQVRSLVGHPELAPDEFHEAIDRMQFYGVLVGSWTPNGKFIGGHLTTTGVRMVEAKETLSQFLAHDPHSVFIGDLDSLIYGPHGTLTTHTQSPADHSPVLTVEPGQGEHLIQSLLATLRGAGDQDAADAIEESHLRYGWRKALHHVRQLVEDNQVTATSSQLMSLLLLQAVELGL